MARLTSKAQHRPTRPRQLMPRFIAALLSLARKCTLAGDDTRSAAGPQLHSIRTRPTSRRTSPLPAPRPPAPAPCRACCRLPRPRPRSRSSSTPSPATRAPSCSRRFFGLVAGEVLEGAGEHHRLAGERVVARRGRSGGTRLLGGGAHRHAGGFEPRDSVAVARRRRRTAGGSRRPSGRPRRLRGAPLSPRIAAPPRVREASGSGARAARDPLADEADAEREDQGPERSLFASLELLQEVLRRELAPARQLDQLGLVRPGQRARRSRK